MGQVQFTIVPRGTRRGVSHFEFRLDGQRPDRDAMYFDDQHDRIFAYSWGDVTHCVTKAQHNAVRDQARGKRKPFVATVETVPKPTSEPFTTSTHHRRELAPSSTRGA